MTTDDVKENPWNIQSIYEFQYFNCPTCVFKDQSKQEFVNHAYETHPNSIQYLINIKDESIIDIIFPCFKTDIKIEDSNSEDIEDPTAKKQNVKIGHVMKESLNIFDRENSLNKNSQTVKKEIQCEQNI